MGKLPEKKAFSYYKSYHEILKHLNDRQYVQLSRAINNVMFFEVHIDSVKFDEPMLNALWASIKYSLQASIDGFTSKNKVDYNSLLITPYQGAYQGAAQDPYQQVQGEEEGKGKEKGQEQGQEKGQYIAHSRFDEFWKLYPKKTGKLAAQKAWDKAKISKDTFLLIIAAVEKAKKSQSWIKDNGQYIPNPATWINQGRWMDEEVEVHGDGLSDAGRRTLAACQRVFGS